MASQCAFGFAAAAALVALRARAALRRLAPPGGVDDDAGSFAVIPGAPKQLSTRSSLFTKKKKYPRHINLEAAVDPKELSHSAFSLNVTMLCGRVCVRRMAGTAAARSGR